jgi:hypothetical protein
MTHESFGDFRALSREHIHAIWQKAKENDLDELSEDEQRLAKILLEHKDEFFHHLEFTDAVSDYDYEPGVESNPFLHIAIHEVIENQLSAREPVEAYQFYNAMLKKKLSHHDTIHLLGRIFIPFLFDVLKYGKEFDEQRYVSLLKKYKNKRPEKVEAALERDLG